MTQARGKVQNRNSISRLTLAFKHFCIATGSRIMAEFPKNFFQTFFYNPRPRLFSKVLKSQIGM